MPGFDLWGSWDNLACENQPYELYEKNAPIDRKENPYRHVIDSFDRLLCYSL
jgi:hypothetical protein